MDLSEMNLSFAGCGFLCIYHAGVCAAIKEYAPQLARNKISGASAGSIAAAGLICNICLSEATSIILQVVCKARAGSLQALSPNFNLIGMMRQGLEKTLPANAHILCNGKLFISLTRARDYKNVVVSEYSSKEELIQAILCSSFIPFYCGRTPPEYRGEAYLDGGISDNQPVRDAHTISVSPFSGESDICPTDLDSASFLGFNFYGTSIQFTTQNLFRMLTTLFPPAPEICSRICRQGFEDTLKFLTKNAMTPCAKCLTIQSNALPLPQYKNMLRKKNLRGFQGVNRPTSLDVKPATKRIRADECGTCFERMENGSEPQFSNIPLPKVVQQTLDDCAAAEGRLLKYLRSFRVFRWTMRLMTPVILPCEITLFIIRTLRSWLSKYSTTDFYLLKLQRMVDFVLYEIDSKRLLYEPTRVSCQFAITNLEDVSLSKYQSRLDLNEAGTPIESSLLNASHRNLSRMASAATLNIPPDDIEVSNHHIPTPMCALPATMPVDDEDTVAQLQDYSLNHEAVLAFYYKDEETNQVKVCEIYDMHNPDRSFPCHSSSGRQISCRLPHAHISQMIEIDEDDENKAKTCPPDLRLNKEQGLEVKGEENQFPLEDLANSIEKMQEREAAEDSGLSLTEDSSHANEATKKRDACCSPVRPSIDDPSISHNKVHSSQFNQTDGIQDQPPSTPTSNSVSSSRRHTMSGSRKSTRSNKSTGSAATNTAALLKKISVSSKAAAVHNNNCSTSSDCEDNDNESLFVPAKSSNLVHKRSNDANASSSNAKIPKNAPSKAGLGKLLTGLRGAT